MSHSLWVKILPPFLNGLQYNWSKWISCTPLYVHIATVNATCTSRRKSNKPLFKMIWELLMTVYLFMQCTLHASYTLRVSIYVIKLLYPFSAKGWSHDRSILVNVRPPVCLSTCIIIITTTITWSVRGTKFEFIFGMHIPWTK